MIVLSFTDEEVNSIAHESEGFLKKLIETLSKSQNTPDLKPTKHVSNDSFMNPALSQSSPELVDVIRDIYTKTKDKILAIKEVRSASRCSLKEAKDLVEDVIAREGL